jgi:hypothetical protein
MEEGEEEEVEEEDDEEGRGISLVWSVAGATVDMDG